MVNRTSGSGLQKDTECVRLLLSTLPKLPVGRQTLNLLGAGEQTRSKDATAHEEAQEKPERDVCVLWWALGRLKVTAGKADVGRGAEEPGD